MQPLKRMLANVVALRSNTTGKVAAMISLRLMGGFEVRGTDGAPASMPGRRSIAVLACMADDMDGSWSRDRMARLLWPRRGDVHARASLRQELVRLRTALAPILSEAHELWKGADDLFLPPELFDIDTLRLRIAAKDSARAHEVLRLCGGELLEEFSADESPFGQWLADRRGRIKEIAIAALTEALDAWTLTEADENQKHPLAQRLLELEPWSERTHRWLIGYYQRHGEREKALEQFRRCEEQVSRHLGARPSAETQMLAAELGLAGHAEQRPHRRTNDGSDWIAWVREVANAPLPPAPRRMPPILDRPSLVVLPLTELGPAGTEGPMLALGLTEEITDALSRVPGFFVTARHSASGYAGGGDVRRIASDLGVRYLVEGTVLHDGIRLRVKIRLIEGGSGSVIWSGSHEGPVPGLMQLRDSIVFDIVGRLQPELYAQEVRRALQRPLPDLDAWGWLQRAHSAIDAVSREASLTDPLTPLRRALEIDPNYGMAHALAAAVRTWRANSRLFPNQDQDRRIARMHAEQALRLDPANSYVLSHCAETALYSAGDIDAALQLADEALRRNPSDPRVLAIAANARRFAGEDPGRSVVLIDQAKRLSPRDRRTYTWEHYSNWCHWKLRDYEAMEAAARRSIELYSRFPWSWLSLVSALGLQQRWPEAARAAAEMQTLMPQFSATAFFETARSFYGRRFVGEAEAGYTQLREILDTATAAATKASVDSLRPRIRS